MALRGQSNEHGNSAGERVENYPFGYTWQCSVRPLGHHVEPTWYLSVLCVVENNDDMI